MNQNFEFFYLLPIPFLSWGLTLLYKNWAISRSVIDVPNQRSSHSTPVPRGGGVAFVLVFYLSISLIYFAGGLDQKLFLALLPGLALVAVGFIDDLNGVKPLIRVVVQIICAAIVLFLLGDISSPYDFGFRWFWWLISLVGIVWFINLFNFLDGTDGYASMEAVTVSIALFYFTGSDVSLILALSVGGFLYWNWPKAKIFMGDSGSTVLGFTMGVVAVYLNNTGIFGIQFWLILTMLFWFDASITLFRRFLNKENLSVAHKRHMYQRLVQHGFTHRKTMFLGLLLNVFLFLICLLGSSFAVLQIPGFLLGILILSMAMCWIDRRVPFK